ncbi:hypothetical protein COL5a_010504 [Colletotrichum fioriniae]|nr:hypothetical protein COL5a_010504 [Colletotrichum fioriniae]
MITSFLVTALALATVTSASPIARSSSKNAWDLEWISTKSSLPKVIHDSIYSAGGTILSASNYSRLDNIAYGSGPFPKPYDLIGNVSEVLEVAQLAVVELDAPGGSAGLNSSLGLVILGPGAAAVSPSARAAAAELLEQRGIPTIAVARPVTGTGVPSPFPGPLIYSSYLGGEQARIMLQLAINAGYDIDAIRGLFESPLRRAIYDTPANQKFYYSG